MMQNDGYYVGELDGKTTPDFDSFLDNIAVAFKFPDYYGRNMNAAWDCLCDLTWIEEPNFILVIKNSASFLSREDEKNRKYILSFLQEVKDDWEGKNNHNYPDKDRRTAEFIIQFD